ncbi:AAA domain-containing protein [Sphingomonas sp. Leaf208]|uniref:AAA domain-containing protein n=1 Tax=Sphingomonas sp. Leaf208 TaxID=1735679 RepID=UPI00138F92BB|nr:AAA domain-containing protein [Sphingomonas sp. Leaf208]
MAKKSGRRNSNFLGKYRLDDAYLRAPDRKTGRVGLIEGTGPGGEHVLVKTWPRSARQNDADLESIWRNEIRQLHRMAGHPVAHEVIARLADAGSDQSGFYLVIEPGARRPIATSLDQGRAADWMNAPRQPANRVRTWRNLKRIALGLEALHSEGMLHRDLDAWSVLSAGSEEPDFQLTGFEWSMRLATSAAPGKATVRKSEGAISFRGDWSAFAKLTARLIDADWERVANLGIPAFEVAEHLFAAEVRLLRVMSGLESLDVLDGDVVLKRIDQIITTVAAEAAGKEAKLHLVLDLRANSAIARTVAARFETDTASIAAELPAIIENDLSEGPLLVAVAEGDEPVKLMLRGHDFWYRLRPYRAPRALTSSWEYAECASMARQGPAPINVAGTLQLAPAGLELIASAEAPARFARSRGRVRGWDTPRAQMTVGDVEIDAAAEFHRALTLTLVIELLFAVAETFPVQLLPARTADTAGDEVIIHAVPRSDPERDGLSDALDIASPSDRLDIALTGDGLRREGWILTTEENLGQQNARDGEWKFDGILRRAGKQNAYRFRGATRPSDGEPLFLVPEDSVGRDTQLRRRLKALGALRDHLELQRALTSPVAELTASHDPQPADAELGDLDESKREALRQIIGSLPLFLVQGPPGVGKTRLVRELVKRRLNEEPTMRFLLSAQSNAAVNHLLGEVVPAMQHIEPAPLIVRTGANREGEAPSEHRLALVSQRTLGEIAASDLVANARPALRERFLKLERGARANDTRKAGTKSKHSADLRNFEGVVMRAANLVFATTNSADLERMIEEHSQFDWSIIEEAGKATGTELIAPQLLSHRRLMIGDHKQLPPFNADRMIAFLSMPEKVAGALGAGADFIGRSLRDETTEAILDEVEENPETAAALCARAIEATTLFQTLIEHEFRRKLGRSGRKFAMRLNEQHRMHPAIARIIGITFYSDHEGNGLTTHAESEKRFATKPCPIMSLDPSKVPEVPILLIDIPSKQASGGNVRGEESPRWHNREEREAVRLLLSQLRPAGLPGAPTMALLSPYAEQVKRMRDMLAAEPDLDPALLGFAAPGVDERRCFTVDSFQGSEADITIISLVRNNSHTNIRSALGFLSDFRRMNVLLSRAKWRLIVIGSFDFLKEILEGARIQGRSAEIEFIGTLFQALDDAPPTDVRRISIVQLREGEA